MSYLGNQKYLEDQIMTNHPVENTILLYEKCIQRMRTIPKYYEEFKYSLADEQIDILERTMHELMASVDRSADEELADLLYSQYNYMLDKLIEIKNFRKVEPLGEIESMLFTLIDAFKNVLRNTEY